MRVLIVSHYFPPEIGAPQARLSDLARRWAEGGDDVVVLTGMPNHPTGVVPPEYRRRLVVEEDVGGHRVLRTWLYATPNDGVLKKTLGHLSFMASSVLLGGRRAGPADVVVVSSPTFFSIFAAWVLARVKRARFVVEIRDLWPAIFVELGILRNRALIRALEVCEMAAYGAAEAVVVVSEGFRDNLVARGVPASKIEVIPNGVEVERFAGATRAEDDRRWLGAGACEVLVLYIGAHGISHGLTAVADAARQLADVPVHVAFVGEGAAKRTVEERVRELGLTNVTFRAGVPRERVPALLAAADICLVPLRALPLFDSFIPSKMFEYFAAGKAVLGSVSGEAAEILRAAGAVVVGPEDAVAIAGEIRSLAADAARRTEMGHAAQEFVASRYHRRVLAQRYRALLGRVVAGA